MKVKVLNRSSVPFEICQDFVLEMEDDSVSKNFLQLKAHRIEASKKLVIGLYEVQVGLESGLNCLAWLDLRINAFESLSLKLRLAGKKVGSHLTYSISSKPYGSLKPGQEWHSGSSKHNAIWVTNSGTFKIEYSRRHYGLSIIIEQICLSSSEEGSKPKIEETEYFYENQGKNEIFNKLSYGTEKADLLGRDCFTSEDGIPVSDPENLPLPIGREWDGPWRVEEHSPGIGESGWVYAKSWEGPWYCKPGLFSKVRRRKWVRHMKKVEDSSALTSFPHSEKQARHKHIHIDADGFDFEQEKEEPLSVTDSIWFYFERYRYYIEAMEFFRRGDEIPTFSDLLKDLKPSLRRQFTV